MANGGENRLAPRDSSRASPAIARAQDRGGRREAGAAGRSLGARCLRGILRKARRSAGGRARPADGERRGRGGGRRDERTLAWSPMVGRRGRGVSGAGG